MDWLKWLLVPVGGAIAIVLSGAMMVQAQIPWKLIAIGDLPYSETEQDVLNTELRRAIAAAQVPFVVHYGDIKSGGEACTDALLTSRRNEVWNLQPGRVFYTPGDNEWTDCDRDTLTEPLPELERLAKIRALFFPSPLNLPPEWGYQSQPNFPENARWRYQNVLLVTLHLVGTNNGRQQILRDDPAAAIALVEARDQANRVWLQESFALASREQAEAVVIITQADVSAPQGVGPCTPNNPSDCDAYLGIREQLQRAAAQFARPVLLIHGDTNPYCLDRDFGGSQAPKLWRLNAWGDFQTPPDATLIVVQPANPNQPFAMQTLMGQRLPDPVCVPES